MAGRHTGLGGIMAPQPSSCVITGKIPRLPGLVPSPVLGDNSPQSPGGFVRMKLANVRSGTQLVPDKCRLVVAMAVRITIASSHRVITRKKALSYVCSICQLEPPFHLMS